MEQSRAPRRTGLQGRHGRDAVTPVLSVSLSFPGCTSVCQSRPFVQWRGGLLLLSDVGTSFWSEFCSLCSFMCLWTVPAPSRLVPYEGPVMRESHGTDGASGGNGCDGSSRVVQYRIH